MGNTIIRTYEITFYDGSTITKDSNLKIFNFVSSQLRENFIADGKSGVHVNCNIKHIKCINTKRINF